MPAKKGRCTICGEVARLTSDHVPPKSVMPDAHIIIERFARELIRGGDAGESIPGRWSAEFKAVCAHCNNVRLGSAADPALARFANEFKMWVRVAFGLGWSLPPYAAVSIQPALVARAVFGHLLAGDGARDTTTFVSGGSLNNAMRRYFLSDEVQIPPEITLLVWPYPCDVAVIGKSIGHQDAGQSAIFVMDVLKFYPVAFGVVETSELVNVPWKTAINSVSVTTIAEATTIDIPLRAVPRIDWPEAPSRRGFVLTHGPRVMIVKRRPSAS
jgi:hypothetical protein